MMTQMVSGFPYIFINKVQFDFISMSIINLTLESFQVIFHRLTIIYWTQFIKLFGLFYIIWRLFIIKKIWIRNGNTRCYISDNFKRCISKNLGLRCDICKHLRLVIFIFRFRFDFSFFFLTSSIVWRRKRNYRIHN